MRPACSRPGVCACRHRSREVGRADVAEDGVQLRYIADLNMSGYFYVRDPWRQSKSVPDQHSSRHSTREHRRGWPPNVRGAKMGVEVARAVCYVTGACSEEIQDGGMAP